MDELDLFTEALNRTDPSERAAFLDQVCAGNPELRQRIEALLAGHDQSKSPLDRQLASDPSTETTSPTTAAFTGQRSPEIAQETIDRADTDATLTATRLPTPSPAPTATTTDKAIGTVIAGRFTLIEAIGEGGMGSVYRANQTQPVRREVALKLIKTGMDSHSVLARFDAERQALALMDHPNIARIYDGGLTPDGQPFFVMELVHGVPLTNYCDQKRLSVKARLELFVSVCQAVQHAHQKGIIHRDLKPGNVLVTEVDGRPTPKVIDFGVAKATEQRLTDMSFADTGAIVGTPTYMSPEQADPTSMDIDTRTDVYALGVMLYELLVGSPPLDAKQFQRGAILEMLRMVREVDPPRPSTKLSHAEALPNIAANRSIEPGHLTRLLQGELDWVVMKALEKDRTRRYDTANGFARDIQRYLADEVVEARPPSRGYRFKKFVKRNKIQVIATSLVLLALVLGVIGTTIGLFEARRQEGLANDAANKARMATIRETARAEAEAKERQRAEKAEAETRARADELKQVSTFQAQMLDRIDTNKAGQMLAKDVLDRFSAALTKAGVPETEKDAQIKAFADQWKRINPVDVSVAFFDREILTPAVKAIDDEFKTQPLVEAQLRQVLATLYTRLGLFDAAIPLQARSLEARTRLLGENNPTTLYSLVEKAALLRKLGKLSESESVCREAYEKYARSLGEKAQPTIEALGNLGAVLSEQGKYTEAEPLIRDALERGRKEFGNNHPETLKILGNYSMVIAAQGRFKEAEPFFLESLESARRVLGNDHVSTLYSINRLAVLYLRQRQPARAEPYCREVLERGRRVLGEDHPDTVIWLANFAGVLRDLGKLSEAEPLYREAAAKFAARLGDTHPNTLRVKEQLAILLFKSGQGAAAAKLADEILSKTPQANPQRTDILMGLGGAALAGRFFPDAERLLREALALRQKSQPEVWTTFGTQSLLGGALLGQKKYNEAEPLLLSGYKGMKQREVTIPPLGKVSLPEAVDRLIELSTATSKPDDVKKWQAERAKYPPTPPPPPGQKR